MQHKNIYILFPAGYSGTYLSWCLDKSELSTCDNTIDDPINKTKSDKYGGIGTCHQYHRHPTHGSIDHIMSWLILNQPKDKRNYLINVWSWAQFTKTISSILNFDRDPIIIHITASDEDTKAIGTLNAVTKWPIVFDTFGHQRRFGIDFHNMDDSIVLRNKLVKYYKYLSHESHPMNFEDKQINEFAMDSTEGLMKFSNHPDNYYFQRHWITNWYGVRNKYTPHEVNEEQFVKPYKLPKNYHVIDLQEIYQSNFPSRLESIVTDKDIGSYNFDYVKSFHQNYIDNQQYIKYPEEIQKFRETGILTEYLNSHPLLRALVIINLLPKLPVDYDWESKDLTEIVDFYNQTIDK